MLRRIFKLLTGKTEETPSLAALLRGIDMAMPVSPLSDPAANGVPALVAGRILSDFYDPFCPVRSAFRDVMLREAVGREDLSLQDIEGCVNSRSQLTSFNKMAGCHGVTEMVEKYGDDIEPIAASVFKGSRDCIAREGDSATVFRQGWDKKMWFANDGGSHRAATVRLIDAQNGYERFIKSDIVEFDVSPRIKDICRDHAIFLFGARDTFPLMENYSELKAQGVLFCQSRDDCCLIVPKKHPEYLDVKSVMSPVFDFSKWAENPESFDFHAACSIQEKSYPVSGRMIISIPSS